MPIACLEAITKDYRLGQTTVQALRGVDLTLDTGEFVALCGPSGSGKTSLLNILGCIDRPTSGNVTVAGQDLAELDDAQLSDLRSRALGFIFQSFNLIPVLTAYENVEYPLLLRGVGSRERHQRVSEALSAVKLHEHTRHRPAELSGGQQQRVAVARALITRPQLVLADEPTASLDTATGAMIVEFMREMRERHGCTFLFSTHDGRVLRYADRIVHLLDGRIASEQELAADVGLSASPGPA
jgi:putative ABC transport system ATP-binding protein